MITQKQFVKKQINDTLDWTYTSLPASVITYDEKTQTATVQPLINYTWEDGVVHEDPPIEDVPIIFPSAGGGMISFPVAVGDTVLLQFCMRAIGDWVEGDGSASTPLENRTHELSDAVAIPGLYPKRNTLEPDPDNVEIKFKGNKITLKTNGDVVIEAGKIELGAGASESVILGDAFKAIFDTHVHGAAGTPPVVPLPPSTLSNKVFTK